MADGCAARGCATGRPARVLAAAWQAFAALLAAAPAAASDGSYGRLDGDLGLSLEAGMSQTLGAESLEGQTLALRATATYLQTVGLTAQYNDSFGIESQPLERAVSGGVELRPLFLGRFASDLERGPAHFDLLLDSLSLGLGVYGAWTRQPPCIDELESCFDHGIDWSVGLEIPLLARASTPFVGLRGSLRLSLAEERLADRPMSSGMLTVTLGYRHLFEAQIVDAGDSLGE